jgi:hypothetical protein
MRREEARSPGSDHGNPLIGQIKVQEIACSQGEGRTGSDHGNILISRANALFLGRDFRLEAHFRPEKWRSNAHEVQCPAIRSAPHFAPKPPPASDPQ